MKCVLFESDLLKQKSNKNPSIDVIARKVVDKIELVWERASIPTVSFNRTLKMLKDYHTKYRNILKNNKNKDHGLGYRDKLASFKEYAEKRCSTFQHANALSFAFAPVFHQRRFHQ
jgi:hypothetical protein